jgi:TolB-like protein/tRNA A-37 threonylcarbamoyl transferase component Bud32
MNLVNQTISHYKIISRLGAGGMGEVYLAQDTQLGRRVAIKVLSPELVADELSNKRLVKEARAAATLDHSNICSIYEIGEADGRSFIAMQYLEGETLDARINREPLEVKESLAIATQVADALAEAHAHGIIHRDIKPGNIIITSRGEAKVMDFGLARVIAGAVENEAETQSLLTTPGTIMGTIPYMSPEQVRGEVLDGRSDIFSFGVVLYEMLTGRQPFASGSAAATASAILTKEPLPLARFAPDAPEELQRITRKCLEKDCNLRYQNASETRIDLQRLKRESESAHVVISSAPEAKTEADDPPAGNKAVYAFLELFALAFTFEGAASLLRGESLWKIAGAWLVAVTFFVTGIRWPKIRLYLQRRFGSRPGGAALAGIANVPRDRTRGAFTPRKAIVPAAAVLLTFLAAAYFYFPRAGTEHGREIKSLAVLPLRSLDAGDNYLGLGIADAVIRRINQTGELIVRPTSAVRRYLNEDTDALSAALQLNADAVLEGSVQRAGDRLRVSINLLRTSDGASLWADNLDMRMTDIFAIQDTVAQQVASRLRLQLDPSQQARFMKRYTSNPVAYEFYMKGVYSFDQRMSLTKAQWEATIDFFKQAIGADPNFALAHAHLSYAYATKAVFVETTEPVWAERAKEEINRAQTLDPQLAETHLARYMLLFSVYEGFQGEAAVREVLLAQQLNPNVGHAELGYLYLHIGLEDFAARELQRALDIDPTSEFAKGQTLGLYEMGGKFDEWLAAHERFFPNEPISVWYLLGKGRLEEAQKAIDLSAKNQSRAGRSADDIEFPKKALLFALKGDFRSAEAEIPSILEKHPVKDPIYHHAAYDIACIYALEGKSVEAVKWLREAAAMGFSVYPLFERDAYLARIRQAPEFIQFMSEVKTRCDSYRREFGEGATR